MLKKYLKRLFSYFSLKKREPDLLLNEIRKTRIEVNKINKRIQKLKEFQSREAARLERTNYQQLTTYMELRRVLNSGPTLPPLRGFAVSPDLVFYLIELLNKHKPKRILEFGSGLSSVILSRYASENNATVLSIDHEELFSSKSKKLVKDWGFEKIYTLKNTQVIEQESSSGPVLFYDSSAIPSSDFDFVFLDGPPQAFGKEVRGGLLPLCKSKLSSNCIIVMDDYYREGEKNCVNSWIKSGYVELIEENLFIEKQSAVLRLKK